MHCIALFFTKMFEKFSILARNIFAKLAINQLAAICFDTLQHNRHLHRSFIAFAQVKYKPIEEVTPIEGFDSK